MYVILFCFNFENYTCSINNIFNVDSYNYSLHVCIDYMYLLLMNHTGKFYTCL